MSELSTVPEIAQSLVRFDTETREPLVGRVIVALASNSEALAKGFAQHAMSEALGTGVMRGISKAAQSLHPDLSAALVNHASDEWRHANIFAGLSVKLSERTPQLEGRLAQPDVDERGDKFDGNFGAFMWTTHVAERRNLFWLDAYLEHAHRYPLASAEGIASAISSIKEDERRHIEYTGEWASTFFKSGSIGVHQVTRIVSGYRCSIWWEAAMAAVALSETEQDVAGHDDMFDLALDTLRRSSSGYAHILGNKRPLISGGAAFDTEALMARIDLSRSNVAIRKSIHELAGGSTSDSKISIIATANICAALAKSGGLN